MSLIICLEQKALNNNISITDLLRTALAVAIKLDVQEFEEWINNELNGYKDVDISEIKKVLPQVENKSDRAEINADITTIEQQLKSPRPKFGIVYELLGSIRNVMEGAGGNLLASCPAIVAMSLS